MRLDIGRYPTKDEGLEMLETPPQDPRAAGRWQGPYLSEKLPLDPWGNPYQYEPDTANSVILYSFGADGKPGGEGVNADVGFLPRAATADQNTQQQGTQ
jgi:general secretion pathway protein G